MAEERVIRTKMAILGGGKAGITAAKTLQDQNLLDFVVVEARHELGGRMQTHTLGNNVTVELGPMWIQGVGSPQTHVNPIYTLALEHDLKTNLIDMSNITTFNSSGEIDVTQDLLTYAEKTEDYIRIAGERIEKEQPDLSARAGFKFAGINTSNYIQDAIEFVLFDTQFTQPPEMSSLFGTATNANITNTYFSEVTRTVTDPRGFKSLVQEEAKTFLNGNDSRLLLDHVVKRIEYSPNDVRIITNEGLIIEAEYAICTFSLGVLQQEDVEFSPSVPTWKRAAILGTTMGTFTKVFLRFNTSFWSQTQILAYADQTLRGHYAIWLNWDTLSVDSNSHTLMAVLTDRESIKIQRQSEEETISEAMAVLRSMFGTDIPDPVETFITDWSSDPLFRGAFTNWAASYPLELFQKLREPLGKRLWFAGEATSPQFFGYLQGAYYEGQIAASEILQSIAGSSPFGADGLRLSTPRTWQELASLSFLDGVIGKAKD